jgi:hypothetical protein
VRVGSMILGERDSRSILAASFALAAIVLTALSLYWSWDRTSSPPVKDEPAEARITITVTPKDAVVVFDGEDTLARGELALVRSTPGVHHLSVSMAGYTGVHDSVELQEGDNPPRSYALSKPKVSAYARLKVRTSPPGAKIYIDGSPVGETEYSNDAISSGSHTLRVVSPGQKNIWEERISLQSGKTLEVPLIDFTRQVHIIVYAQDPAGERIAGYLNIDGQALMSRSLGQRVKTPARGQVTVGQHRFQVIAEEYEQQGGVLTKNIRNDGEITVILRKKAGH